MYLLVDEKCCDQKLIGTKPCICPRSNGSIFTKSAFPINLTQHHKKQEYVLCNLLALISLQS